MANDRVSYPDPHLMDAYYSGSLAVPKPALMYLSSGVAYPASNQSDQGTPTANAFVFAGNFLGVSMERKVATDAAGTVSVSTDILMEVPCTSNTFNIGDKVTVEEKSSGTALEDFKVRKTTSEDEAIGYVWKRYASATTKVLVRFLSNVVKRDFSISR